MTNKKKPVPVIIGTTKVELFAYVGPNGHVVRSKDHPHLETFLEVWQQCPDGCSYAVIKYGAAYVAVDMNTVHVDRDAFSIVEGATMHSDVDAAIMIAVLRCADQPIGARRNWYYGPTGPVGAPVGATGATGPRSSGVTGPTGGKTIPLGVIIPQANQMVKVCDRPQEVTAVWYDEFARIPKRAWKKLGKWKKGRQR